MPMITRRSARAGWTVLALAGLSFLDVAATPAPAHATGVSDAGACLVRTGILQVGCLLNATMASPQAAARTAAARLCQQTLQARLQVCHTRSNVVPSTAPPTSAALSGPPPVSTPTVTTDKFEYRAGDTVTISGAGWQTNERVTLRVHVNPALHADVQFFAVADEDGNFTSRAYTVQASDAGATLSVTATGRPGDSAQIAAFVDPAAAPLSFGSKKIF